MLPTSNRSRSAARRPADEVLRIRRVKRLRKSCLFVYFYSVFLEILTAQISKAKSGDQNQEFLSNNGSEAISEPVKDGRSVASPLSSAVSLRPAA